MRQVDDYLARLRRAQEVEMREIEERVSHLRHEREILLAKRQSLEETKTVRADGLATLQKEYEQIDAAGKAATEMADREIADLWSNTRKRLLAYETAEADMDQRAERLRDWSKRALSGLAVTGEGDDSGSRGATARAMIATLTAVDMGTVCPADRPISTETTIDTRSAHSEHDTELTEFWGDAFVQILPEPVESEPTPADTMEPVSRTSMESGPRPTPTPVPPPEHPSQPAQAAASPAISQEVRAVRHRYVIGKIAGQDLYDSRGGLIIAKTHVITADVIDYAEKEGKLPELIVHMQLPGMGE